ncbi:MAG: FAD-dependent oxidoreductase [Deltaproteobacteria bacterium]|nr:FAD-dependent oxidoreductase [Deltaproteobacteria bacterium]
MAKGNKVKKEIDDKKSYEMQAELRSIFEKIPNEINILLFTSPLKNEIFNESTRNVLRIIRQFAPKITLREFDITHKEAKRLNVEYSPALFINPGRYGNIRWYGAPIGEETRTLVEAIIMFGYGHTHLSPDSIKILDKISSPRDIKIFVSPTCPYCPQQAVNALKAAIEKPDLITLEIIDIQANPDLAEKYSAQSVPQVYSDDRLIAMGAQSEELFMLSLEKMEQQTIFIPESDAEEVESDLVIVGGGPAGLTAGIYGARSGLKTVIIEKNLLGGQVANTPIVENYPGINQIGGKALVDLLVSHALEYVKIFPGEEIIDIQKGGIFNVQSSRRRFSCRALLFATGAEYRRLDVQGESRLTGHGVSYCSTCDGPLFKGKKVLMVGGGDSAVTEALHLHNLGVDVTVVHRRDKLRAQDQLVKALLSNDVPVLYNIEINEIRGNDRVEEVELVNRITGDRTTIAVDGLFIAIGYSPVVELARKTGVDITPDGYIKHDGRHRTNIPGIYSAGDVEGGYKQIVTAAGHGSAAALTIFEDLVNPYWKKEGK